MQQTHELRAPARYFEAVERGDKTFEIRLPDGSVQAEVIGHISGLVGKDAGDTWGVSLVARGRLPPTPPMIWGWFAA